MIITYRPVPAARRPWAATHVARAWRAEATQKATDRSIVHAWEDEGGSLAPESAPFSTSATRSRVPQRRIGN